MRATWKSILSNILLRAERKYILNDAILTTSVQCVKPKTFEYTLNNTLKLIAPYYEVNRKALHVYRERQADRQAWTHTPPTKAHEHSLSLHSD